MCDNDTTFISYNSTGFAADKVNWLSSLIETTGTDFVSLQEHFQSQVTTGRKTTGNASRIFDESFRSFKNFVVPAYRQPGQVRGRASGGLAQLSSSTKDVKLQRVNSNSRRIQAQIIHFPNFKLLWGNVYFPTDPGAGNFDDAELNTVLQEMETVMENEDFDHVLWNGDFNCDFSRNTPFVGLIRDFLHKIGLLAVWENSQHSVNYTHIHVDLQSTSILDHFICNESLLPYISDAGVLHLGDNLSRHSPIMLRLNTGNIPLKPVLEEIPKPRKPAWYKATEEHLERYKWLLHEKIMNIEQPHSIYCNNAACTDDLHKLERDAHCLDILAAICESGQECIPLTRPQNKTQGDIIDKNIPGWKEHVEPYRNSSVFWHSVWMSAGEPVNCELHNVMKRSKNQYHYSVRRVKNLADTIRSSKLSDAALSGNKQLLQEMKKVKSVHHKSAPDHVDAVSGINIPNIFADVYRDLFNSADDKEDILSLKQRLQGTANVNDLSVITPNIVKTAAKSLKSSKNDVSEQFKSDSLIHAPDVLFERLADLFKAFFTHADFPEEILACAFIPLLKGPLKDDTSSENYRAIAMSSLIFKVMELVIMSLFGDKLYSDDLQFGYKSKTSTTQCTWLALQTISYFKQKHTSVNVAALDCSKAFDKCLFSKLFGKILDRGVPAIFVRGLLAAYELQKACVKWSATQTASYSFGIQNGTRQGSCLSPILFTVYMDGLLVKLRESGFGCYIGDLFLGVVAYCDDFLLLSPTRNGLQNLLQICEKYAEEHNISFSTNPDPSKSKSKCIYFACGRDRKPVEVVLNHQKLPWVSQVDHLGHIIHESGSQDVDCRKARGSYIGSSTELLGIFHFCSPLQKLSAVQTYCCSFYGSNIWNLFSEYACQTYRSWNTTVKVCWNLPQPTHTYFVKNFSKEFNSVRVLLLRRFAKFAQSILHSWNPMIWQVGSISACSLQYDFGSNISNISDEFSLDILNSPPRAIFEECGPLTIQEEDNIECLQHLLLQLRDCEEDDIREELKLLVQNLCTN